jgi:hypothetical protein
MEKIPTGKNLPRKISPAPGEKISPEKSPPPQEKIPPVKIPPGKKSPRNKSPSYYFSNDHLSLGDETPSLENNY